ncbi:MAG: hypothetical protein QNK11_04550 [Legionella sp.]|nr:hypothetical protein [Legionella sp.]
MNKLILRIASVTLLGLMSSVSWSDYPSCSSDPLPNYQHARCTEQTTEANCTGYHESTGNPAIGQQCKWSTQNNLCNPKQICTTS